MCEDVCFPVSAPLYYLFVSLCNLGKKIPYCVISNFLVLKAHIAVILFLDALSLCLSFCYAVTLSDCYVTLWLPTASTEKVRTRTIRNSKNPVWNEAFCYKIDRRVKVTKMFFKCFSLFVICR